MSWFNNLSPNVTFVRRNKYNNSVAMNQKGVWNMLSNFDGLFRNAFTNFTSEIASLQLYPFIVPHTETGSTLQTTHIDASDAYAEIIPYNDQEYFHLGQHFISPHFNNFADYDGYTKIKVFLPFHDFVDVDVNQVMGKYLQIRLSVDYNTGQGIYILGVSDAQIPPYTSDMGYTVSNAYYDRTVRVISKYVVQLGIVIPLGQSAFADKARNAILKSVQTVASVAAAAYTGALPPPTTTSETTTSYQVSGRGTEKGSRMKVLEQGSETSTRKTTYNKARDVSKPISEAISGSIDVLNTSSLHGTGDRIGDSMLMWNLSTSVHIVFYRPKMLDTTPEFRHLFGQPLGQVRQLSELSGYTELTNIHIEGEGFSTATKEELDEIQTMLYGGILLGEGNLVRFTINGTTYTADENSTWAQWISSGYNTSGYTRDISNIVSAGGAKVYLNGEAQTTSTIIQANASYTHNIRFWSVEDYYEVSPGSTWGDFISEQTPDHYSIDTTDNFVIYDGDVDQYIVDNYGNEQFADTILIDNGIYDIVSAPTPPPTGNIEIRINGNSYWAPRSDSTSIVSSMTWSEWVNSDYNTGGFRVFNGVLYDANDKEIIASNSKKVLVAGYPISITNNIEYFTAYTFALGDEVGQLCLPNQTWGEWVETSLNTLELYIDTTESEYIVYDFGGREEYLRYNENLVSKSDEIIDGAIYDYNI